MITPIAPEGDRFQRVFAVAIVVLFSALFFRLIAPFAEAVLLAAALAGLLHPMFRRILRHIPKRSVASLLTVAFALLVIIVPLMFLVVAFAREAFRLTEELAPWIQQQVDLQQAQARLPDWIPFSTYLQPYRTQILQRFGDMAAQAGGFFVDGVSAVTQGTLLFILNLFVMLYTLFFFLLAGQRWLRFFRYTPLPVHDREVIIEKGISIARATLKGTLIIGFVQGFLGGVAFAVAGLPAALFWGVMMGLASIMIPTLGTAIVWVPAVAYLFLSDQVVTSLLLALWCAGVVSTIDNVLRPRLVGNDTRMPDVLILLSTLGGIAMFGVTGIVIGPLIAGFFITAWHLFAAAFREELRETESAPELLDEDAEGVAHHESNTAPENRSA